MDRIDTALLVVLGFAGLVWLGGRSGWAPALRVRRLWTHVAPYVRCYVRRSPATFAYAAILFVTTWVVAGVGPRISEALLRSQSTNLENLRAHPLNVLFRSMFWTGSTTVLPFVALLALVLAPAEVWLGTARVIGVFLAGHVGATVATAIAIGQGYFTAAGDRGIDRTVDVGVSYGVLCVAAVLTHRLPPPWRLPYATGLVLLFGLSAFVVGKTFTDFGHLVTVLIGFALYPLATGRTLDERARIPLYRPWREPEPR